MRRKRLLWQIYPSYLIITAVTLIALGWYAYLLLGRFYEQQALADLQARALILEELIAPQLAGSDLARVDAICKQIGPKTGTLITVALPTGQVVGDSRDDPAMLESQLQREEFTAAFRGEVGRSRRYVTRVADEMSLVAVPIRSGGQIIGALRTAQPYQFAKQSLSQALLRVGIGAMSVAALAALVSLWISRRATRPLHEIKAVADRIAQGDFDSRVPTSEYEELAELSASMNKMAEQLDARFRTAQRQRLEQEAIVSSMVEGVLAIDAEQRVISLNKAAALLLSINPADVVGRSIIEVIRNNDLQRLVSKTFLVGEPVEGDIALSVFGNGDRFLQAHGTLLRNPSGEHIGALVVLNDVTRLRKLENLRRDFVANVSHELKTPITSIKGFVETLIDGAAMDAEERSRFLHIIVRQANRLHHIIEDLLKLSRIEQESERGEVLLEVGSVQDVLQAAISTSAPQAEAKQISITLRCDHTITARINPQLLEQAVANLIENAIKYSDDRTEIVVSALARENMVAISVRDQGYGIAKEHLPRLFERFYRVDKARSRSQGGTGLGLAIVKHIVLAHGGNISVQSEPGQGSTFTILLARS